MDFVTKIRGVEAESFEGLSRKLGRPLHMHVAYRGRIVELQGCCLLKQGPPGIGYHWSELETRTLTDADILDVDLERVSSRSLGTQQKQE